MATYRNFVSTALESLISGHTVKALLVTSTYVYDEDGHEFLSDINATGAEVAAGGYSRQTLTGVSVDYDVDIGVFVLAGDVNFGTFTQSGVLGPIFYIDTGTAGTSRLICADVDTGSINVTTAVATIYRIDTAQGFLLAQL